MSFVPRFIQRTVAALPAPFHIAAWLGLFVLSGCATNQEIVEQAADHPIAVEAADESAVQAPVATPEGFTAELLYELLLSNIAFQRGEIDVASDALIKAAHQTDDIEVVSRAVRMAVHSQNYQQGLALGQRWISLAPDDHQAYIITALAAVQMQQEELGLRLLRELLQQDSAQIHLRFGQLGELFLQHAEGETAQNVVRQLAGEYSDTADAWLVVAGMAQKNQDLVSMVSALDEVLTIEPDNEKAAAYKLLALAGDQAQQDEFASRFLVDNPAAHSFRMQYAQLLLRREDDQGALEQLLALLDNDTENSEAMSLIALLYQAREEYQQAAEYFTLRIKAVSDDDRSRLYLANAYQHLKRYDEAKQVLAEVSDPGETYNAGRQMALLIEEADGADAGLAYARTLRGSEELQTVQLIIDQQLMLQRAGRSEEAYTLVDKAMAQYPHNENLRYHRALVAVERSDLGVHESDMQILLKLKPDNPHYNNTLGYTLLVSSDDRLQEAKALINRAHELKPDDPYILDSKGWLEFRLGNYQLALAYLLEAFELDHDAEIAAHIGEVYWTLDDQEKAREYWREGDKIDPENRSLLDAKKRFLE